MENGAIHNYSLTFQLSSSIGTAPAQLNIATQLQREQSE